MTHWGYIGPVACVFLALVAVGGCKRDVSPDSYSVGSVGQVNRVVRGVIISARPVDIEGTRGVGTLAGAGIGGTAGTALGDSTEASIIGAIGGAVIGGVVGATVEEGVTSQVGIEYVIEAENGALLTIVQGEEDPLQPGARVLVMYGSRAKVIADPSRPGE